jgi:hypothetical protein
MKKIIWLVLAALVLIAGIASAQTVEPTQTPYIIYIVVTATPEPEATEDITIVRSTPIAEEPITLVNGGAAASGQGSDITVTNPTTAGGDYAGTTDELVQRIVATVMAQTSSVAGGNAAASTSSYTGNGGAVVRNSDGSGCTMSFELVSEPTYPAGSIIPRGAVFWKEWLIRNTGTCTWTPDWEFVFDSGWQIGNTRFHMNRTTAPGETLNVRLAMVPDQKQNGNYYSTYAFEAPDGTRFGTITSSYTVQDPSYFSSKPVPYDKLQPQHGREAGPVPCWWYPSCPPPPKK